MKYNRRKFLHKTALATLTSTLAGPIVFAGNLSKGDFPFALSKLAWPMGLPGKHPELRILNDKPWNIESPAHLLNDKITPASKFFVRNNGLMPTDEQLNPDQWTLSIEGESAKKKKTFSLSDLKNNFKNYTYQLCLECGGNGRSEFNPPAKGNQWTTGAVACAEWTGVRLKDVLNAIGLKPNAKYIGYYGKDLHLSGDPKKTVISRGVPISKAMEDESLLAWAMNGKQLPKVHGFPLRLVIGGWPASCSGKWVNKISIRNKEHDGPKMGGQSYRVPCSPVAPGAKVADEDMCIIESMPVKSLITFPKTGAMATLEKDIQINGHAWAGDFKVIKLEYSIDFGATWKAAELEPPSNRLAWQHFKASVSFPQKGFYEIWVKATDEIGNSQPMVLPNWNPRGYLNNACHRIAVKIT